MSFILALAHDLPSLQSMEGLSARSVLINAFCQLVILLYLFDNETSYVVLFSSVLVSGQATLWTHGLG
jgi:hypothetical protein